jgi:hypothetical protein
MSSVTRLPAAARSLLHTIADRLETGGQVSKTDVNALATAALEAGHLTKDEFGEITHAHSAKESALGLVSLLRSDAKDIAALQKRGAGSLGWEGKEVKLEGGGIGDGELGTVKEVEKGNGRARIEMADGAEISALMSHLRLEGAGAPEGERVRISGGGIGDGETGTVLKRTGDRLDVRMADGATLSVPLANVRKA